MVRIKKLLCDSDNKLRIAYFSGLFALLLYLLTQSGVSPTYGNSNVSSAIPLPCECVVFRMDDIQDTFVNNAQIEALNLFISKSKPLSLGLIMNDTGNDLRIIGKVGQGSQIGLFELGLHGWDHVDYTKLSKEEQKSTLKMANEKMDKIFGNNSDIFIPPYGYFDNQTIDAMSELGIRVLSSTLFSERNYDDGASIFNQTLSTTNHGGMTNFNRSIYHMPGIAEFKGSQNGNSIKVPVENILSDTYDSLQDYGYAVIVFHPQDLVQVDENGKVPDNAPINATEMDDLSRLIDTISSRNIRITTLSDILGIEQRSYSYFK